MDALVVPTGVTAQSSIGLVSPGVLTLGVGSSRLSNLGGVTVITSAVAPSGSALSNTELGDLSLISSWGFSLIPDGLIRETIVGVPTAIGHALVIPEGLSVASEVSEASYIFVRIPGLSLVNTYSTEPVFSPLLPHNNSGPYGAGLITPTVFTTTVTNLNGATGGLVYTNAYLSTPTVPTTYQNIEQVWGYEVHTLPGNKEMIFGVITSDKTLTLTIYNKRLDAITLVSHSIPNQFGCKINGLMDGGSILPNQSVTLTVTAKLLLGDEEVSGFCPIYFDKVTIWLWVEISRQPIIVYSMHPDRESYTESYSYKTNVFASTTGREKRAKLMDISKRKVKYSITPTDPSSAHFIMNNLYTGMNNIMYQPLWAFATKTTEVVESSALIPCETHWGIFKENEYCGVCVNEYTVILARIVGVSPNTLEVSKPLSADFGAYVVPLIVGTPETSQSRSYSVSTSQKINIGILEL